MTLRACLSALLLAVSLPCLAASEVIQLNYRAADDVLPVVRSILDEQDKVSPYGNKLVVSASPEKIREVRDLLKQLDTAPRRLLISVDTSESGYQDSQNYALNGPGRTFQRSTDSLSGGVQQVQTTEGYPALIQVGQSVPLTSTSTSSYGQIYQDTQYRNVTQGFYVTASLSGAVVHVRIRSNNDRVNRANPEVIDVQSTDTQVTGRLGEWITLGGVSEQSLGDDSGRLRSHSTRSANDMSLRLKVDALN